MAITVHLSAAVIALVLGAVVLWRPKGTFAHRLTGRAWVVVMATVAISAFWINDIRMWGPFSPLHLLSIVTLSSLAWAIWAIRRGNVVEHRTTLRTLYGAALLIPGAFTLLPGRLLGRSLFPDGMVWVNYTVMAAMIAAGTWMIVGAMRDGRRPADATRASG